MDLLVEKKKRKLVNYITTLENETQINYLFEYISDSEKEEKPFDFETEWKKGISREESQKRVIERLEKRWNK
jgi:hypothetical protein